MRRSACFVLFLFSLLLVACERVPQPIKSPVDSPVPLPSPTPVPLPTSTSSPSFIPSIVPEPTIGSDLIFLSETGANSYELMRWDHTTFQSEVIAFDELNGTPTPELPSDVQQYSVDKDAHKLALTRSKRVGLRLLTEIAVLDLSSKQLTPLVQLDAWLPWTAIAPNAQRIAYIFNGKVYVIQIDAPEQPIEAGTCKPECQNLAWSPDSRMIAWSDKRGLWLVDLSNARPRLLVSDMGILIHNERLGVYAAPVWSPDNRYLLARSLNQADEWGIVDIQTHQIEKLPLITGSYEHNVHATWLHDGRLFVTRSGDVKAHVSPSIEVWRVNPDGKTLLIQDESIVLSVSPQAYLAAPTQLDDGRLAYMILSADDAESGLFTLDINNRLSTRVAGPLSLGYNVSLANTDWLPDGTGAIFYNWSIGAIGFFSINGGTGPSNLIGTCCFTWIK